MENNKIMEDLVVNERNVEYVTNYVNSFFIDGDDDVLVDGLRKLRKSLSANNVVLNEVEAEILLENLPLLSKAVKAGIKSTYFTNENSKYLIALFNSYYLINNISFDNSHLIDESLYSHHYKDHDLNTYAVYIKDIPDKLLTYEEEMELGRRIKEENDPVARELLIVHNLKLVISIAAQYKNKLDFREAIQDGNEGLLKAVERFDYTKGYKFSTYATWWIRQSMQRNNQTYGSTLRLPVHFITEMEKINRAFVEYKLNNYKEPTCQEIADITGFSIKKVEEVMSHKFIPVSLNQRINSGDEYDSDELGSFIPGMDNTEDEVLDNFYNQEIRDLVFKNDRLSDREKIVIALRFGFEGEPMTLEQIGDKFNLTRERIRQIEFKAINKLKKEMLLNKNFAKKVLTR